MPAKPDYHGLFWSRSNLTEVAGQLIQFHFILSHATLRQYTFRLN